MQESSNQWVVRTSNEQVKGPYSTEILRNMIVSGAFTGNEEVSQYPQGEWQVLTKQPEFYDALLESLENPSENDNKKTQKMEAETVIKPAAAKPTTTAAQKEQQNSEPPQFDLKEFVNNQIKADADEKTRMQFKDKNKVNKNSILSLEKEIEKAQSRALINRPQQNLSLQTNEQNQVALNSKLQNALPDLQMTDLKKLEKAEYKKASPLIILVVLLVVAAAYLILIDDSVSTAGNAWSLQAPGLNPSENLSADQIADFKKRAVLAFQKNNFEDMRLAQVGLVKSIESSERDLEAMGLLCMLHQQLWTYTKQTEQDLKSILITTQMARTVNPLSKFSDTCQVSYLLAKGQIKEAKSLVEKTLDYETDEKYSLSPFLYFLKAEMLEYETNFINAEAYYDQAVKLWPQWATARFGLARMNYKLNKMSEARENFEQILKELPSAKFALYGLGLVELKTTKNESKAVDYFANGFKSQDKMLKSFQTEALFTYAKILLERKETALGKKVAEEAYRQSPSNRDLKELVISLGGNEKVEGANSEIVLVGDQFARVGDHLTAQAQYKAAFELDPLNGMAAYKAAKSLWQINQTRDAVNWLDKAIKADPKLLQAYILKADYESQRYNFLAAARTLATATGRFSQNQEVTKALALLEFRKNNMNGAIQYGERAIRIYDADVELLTMLAQAHIYLYQNAPSTRKEDQDKKNISKTSAQRFAGRAIDLEPAWPESQITYAKMLAAIEGPVRGEVYLKELIKAYPYTTEYRIALGEFYKENEKYTDAAKVYEEVVAIDPKSKKANFGLAECYRVLNKSDLAQKYYNLTSALDPSDVEAMFANAKLLIETAGGREVIAKNEQALAKFELVRKINPEFPKVSFFIARCYLELGNFEKAIEMIKEEKSKNPRISDSYILAAEVYYRKAQFKECAAEYSAAIKLRPSTAELYVKASMCYRNSDAMDIAEDLLEMAKERESGYAEIYREQGYILQRKLQQAEAIQAFKKYITLSPNAVDREAIFSEIKKMGGNLSEFER